MGGVIFGKCKDILLYRRASSGLEKKSRDLCGRSDLFSAHHCTLVENISEDVMIFFLAHHCILMAAHLLFFALH